MLSLPVRQLIPIIVALSISSFLAALDQTIVSTALPHIADSLHGLNLYAWVFTAYFLGATATVAITGKLSDLLGRRIVFLTSIAIFGVASLLCGVAGSMAALVAFRCLQGIGAGGIQTTSLAVTGDLFSPRERGKWQIVNSLGFAAGSAIGPGLGGFLSDTFTWRWIFLMNVPICLLAIALLYGLPKSAGQRHPKIDWAGSALSIVGTLSFLLALTWGGHEFAWLSPQIMALAAATLVAGLALRWTERRVSEPLIPPGLVSGSVVPFCCFGLMVITMVWFGFVLLAPLLMQTVLGLSATVTGAILTPGVVLSCVAGITGGMLMSRTGHCRPTVVTAGILTVVSTAMLLFLPAGYGPIWVAAAFTICSLAIGFAIPGFLVALQNAVSVKQLGTGMGVMSLFRQIGGAVGTAIVGALAIAGAGDLARPLLERSIHQAVLVLMVAALASLALAWFMADLPLRSTLTEVDPDERAAKMPVGAA